MAEIMSNYISVCALYSFVALDNFRALRQPLFNQMIGNGIRGTILLASEGINGTVAGDKASIENLLRWIETTADLPTIDAKWSHTATMPFHRSKVKLKKEIVTMGVEDIDPRETVGTYIDPSDWNALISDPEVTVVDTRNDYEIGIGTFKYAINPKTNSFREFPQYVKNNLEPSKQKKIAMFCTGGIRCEKSTAYLKQQGFDEVYHLKGGILKYLETVPKDESLWEGECFVFDDRVAVDHDLQKGSYDQCHGCRFPITEQDKQSECYVKGVSCPRCHNNLSEEQKMRFSEREKQIQLAKKRGEAHIGIDASSASQERRDKKYRQRQHDRNSDTKKNQD